MSEEQLLVTLGVKDANCTTKVKELNKEIKNLDSIYKTTSSTSKNFENTTQGLSQKIEYLNKKYDATKAKLTAYREQMAKAQESVAKKKEELEKLKNSEEKNTQAINKAEKQLQTYQSQLNNASRNVNLTETQLRALETELKNTNEQFNDTSIKEYSSKIKEIGKNTVDLGNKISSAGDKITNAGKKLSVISGGVTAVGYAAKSAYNSVKEGADNVITATGATGEAAEELKETYKNTASSIVGDFGAIGSALGEVNTRFGFTGDTAEECTKSFIKFAKINKTDATTSVQLVSRAMGDAGIQSSDYSSVLDELTVAAQASGVSIDSLTQNITKYGAPMRALGFNMKESISLFASWEKAGVNTEIAFSGMKKAISNWGAAGKDSREEFKKTLQEIKACPDIASATTKAIEVFGAKAGPDLADAIQGGRFAYEDFLKVVEGSQGTVENTYNEITKDSDGTALATQNAKIALSELWQEVIPTLVPIAKSAVEEIKKFTEWFNSLDESTKQNIVRFAEIVVVAGPAVTIFGKLTSGVGKLVSGGGKLIKTLSNISKGSKVASGALKTTEGAIGTLGSTTVSTTTASGGLLSSLGSIGSTALVLGPQLAVVGGAVASLKTHVDLQNESILESTDNMSAFKKVIDNIDGGFHKSNEELEEMGIKYKDFSGDVSDEFKQAVEDCSSKIRDFNQQLHETTLDGVITESETNDLVSRVDKMCQEALATVQSYEDKGKQAMAKAFSADGIVTEDEQKTLDAYGKTFDDAKNIITQKTEENKNLLKQRNEQNYKEIDAQIKKNEEEIGQAQLKIQATNNDELEAIHINFIERIKNVDLQGASDILTEKKAKLDEANQATHDKYDEGIEMLKEQVEKTTGAEQEGYKKQYDNLCNARDRELAKNRENFSQYYNELKENNEKIAENINMITGEIMSEKETRQQNTLLELESHYANLDSITQSGYYQMYNTITGTMDNVAIKIDDSTGQIVGMWEQSTNKCGEAMKGMGNEANNLANTMDLTKASMVDNYMQLANSTVNSSNQMINKNGEVVASLEDVKTHSDGTRTGIVDLNGTPINIQVNENGVISTLDGVLSKMKTISGTAVTVEMRKNWTSDGRGGVYIPDGYAKGTDNATRGVHLVGEKGPELVFFSGGETVLTADKTRNVLSGGGYFSPRSYESKQLINNTNNSTINNYSNMNFDYDRLANTMANALANIVDRLNKSTNPKTIGNNMSYELVMAQRRLRK